MYTVFDMLEKEIRKNTNSGDLYFTNVMLDTVEKIRDYYSNKYDFSNLEDRKLIIKDFLEKESFYFLYPNTTEEYFSKINIGLLINISKIKSKGAPYISKIWNLSPNL